MKVNGKDDNPYMKWKIKVMFETTNQKSIQKYNQKMWYKYIYIWITYDGLENRVSNDMVTKSFIHLPSLVTPNSPRGVPLEIIQPFELADFGNLQPLQAGKMVITSNNHGPWLANVIYKFNNRI